MKVLGQIILFSFLGSVASLIGGVILAMRKKGFTHAQSLLLVSFAAGVLLATAMFDLLPEAAEMWEEIGISGESPVWGWALGGVVFLFVMEKSLIWYHHHHEEEHTHSQAVPVMLTVGDTLHNFIDGIVMGGAFLVDSSMGVVTALAVAAHEIPHEIADFGILLGKGWSRKRTILVNVASAAVAMLGALFIYVARDTIQPWLPHLLAFAGGNFLYLACSDLIPELHHEHKNEARKNGFKELVCFGSGILIVYLLIKWLHG